jgi:CheY-like chemotaxis protein
MGALVLLIDDDHSTLDMMSLVLESEGYHVKTSLTAFEDLKEVENLHPDLIIVDFKIRGRETTWTFLQKLKLFPPTSAIPLFLCTAALKDVREQEATLREKGIPVLYKPFGLDELLLLVHTCLASKPFSS